MDNKQNDMFLFIVIIVLALGGYFYLTGGQRQASATPATAQVPVKPAPSTGPVADAPHYSEPSAPPPPPRPTPPPKKPVNPDDELPPEQIK